MAALASGLAGTGWRVAFPCMPGCGKRGDPKGLTEHLVALRTPTLILHGERDTFWTREGGESYALPTKNSAAVDHQRRPQLQAHQELGPQRGGELGHGFWRIFTLMP